MPTYIDPTAEVDPSATIGEGTRVWGHAYVAPNASIGRNCMLARNTHVGKGAVMGDGCKLQDGSGITTGVTLGNYVFVGPNVTFCNDPDPRATRISRRHDHRRRRRIRAAGSTPATIGEGATGLCAGLPTCLRACSAVGNPARTAGMVRASENLSSSGCENPATWRV